MDILLFLVMTISSVANFSPTYAQPILSNRTVPKIIIDTDFNTIGDDGQVLAMAAQLHASKEMEILGLTVVAGNQYRAQEEADCLKAVERLGIDTEIGVYIGAQTPFLHDYAAYQLEKRLFGNATYYVGAYTQPPEPHQLVEPPDGFATHTKPQKQYAVDFIIDAVHRHPGQVSILAIGPLTNLALAMRQDPSIIPHIQQIVIMGGQIYASGDAFRGLPEFNWWFDPESARVVLRAGVKRKVIPLDVTNTVPVSAEIFDSIANHEPSTAITELVKDSERWSFVYDTVALASLYEPALDLDVRELYVDVNCDETSPEYGQGIVWNEGSYSFGPETSSSVVFQIDNDRFFEIYIDLLTRAVPVVARRSA